MTFFSDRLQSSGVGAILHSLVQTLLRLRLRPANPVQWILTELKAGRYYLEEQSFLLLLQQYVAHAAVAAESNDVDHPTMLAQLVVLCLSNFSAMFVRMHDRRLLDEQSRLTFAVLFADGFMWEQLPTERRLSSSGRDSLRLSEYLQTAGRALKYLACLRQTIVPDEKAEKAIFYSVLDLAEVVLKLRCFAAQGEIDSFGDSVICFDVLEETNETAKKDIEEETGAVLNYSLSMRSRRRLSVQYVIPMAPCTDGMGPTKRQTPLEVLDEMQRLSKSLLSACGFAEASVRFLVCDLPTPPRLQQDTMAALRIRWGPISEPSTLQAALRTTDHLEQQLQNGEHPSLRLHPHSVQRGRYRAPAADDSVCCQNGWCTALQRSLGSSAATTSSAAGDAEMPIADLAPPCVIFLPLPVASLVNAAPLLLVLGSCLCRTLSAALLTAVPTFRAPPVGGDTPSSPAPSTAGKSKKAGKDGGATAAAVPAASAAPSAPAPAAGATVTTPEGTTAARRDAFGDAYEVLFGGLSEAVADPHTTQQPSLFGILLDTSNIVPTISQRAAGVLLTAVLQDVLPLPTSGEKSTTSAGRSPYLSPMLAAFAMTWNPLLANHPDGSCWVRRALSVLGEDPHVDLPHMALFLQLRQQFASEVGLTFSTASTTVDLYASLHDTECDSLPHSMPLHSLLNLLPLAAPLAMGGGDHNSPASPMSPAGGGGSKQAKAGDKGGSGGNAATPAATPLQQAKPHLDQLRVALMGSAPSKLQQQQQSTTVGKRCLEFDRKLVELVTPLRRDPSLKEVATLCLKL